MDVSPGRMTVVTGAGAPFGRKVVRSGVALEVPSCKIQFSSVPSNSFLEFAVTKTCHSPKAGCRPW